MKPTSAPKPALPSTRVIALSMYDEPETVERLRRAGAKACVLKTVPSEHLLAAIRGNRLPHACPPNPVTTDNAGVREMRPAEGARKEESHPLPGVGGA